MTVKELIDELKKFPDNYRVMMEADSRIADILSLEIEKDYEFRPPDEFVLIAAQLK